MTSAELERLRINLLQTLRTSGYVSLPLPEIVTPATLGGFAVNEAIVRGELVYLLDKGLVVTVQKTLSPENKRWRITAAGLDFLAEAGL